MAIQSTDVTGEHVVTIPMLKRFHFSGVYGKATQLQSFAFPQNAPSLVFINRGTCKKKKFKYAMVSVLITYSELMST